MTAFSFTESEKESVVTFTSKACGGISEASKRQHDQIHNEPGQQVHKHCRRVYCKSKRYICMLRKRKLEFNTSASDQHVLLSVESAFNYKEHRLFCGKSNTYNHQREAKGHKLKRVQTGESHIEIETLFDKRKDRWSDTVRGRLNSINDLFAADVMYHQICSINFLTNKSIPSHFLSSEEYPRAKRGRPQHILQRESILKSITRQ